MLEFPTEGLWSSYLITILLTVDHKCTIKPEQNSCTLNLTVRSKIQFCAGGEKKGVERKMNVGTTRKPGLGKSEIPAADEARKVV